MATIHLSQFETRYNFNFLTDKEADTQVPDKLYHCGIFFTNIDSFNTHLESDHKAEEGFSNGKWPCSEKPSCDKVCDDKAKVWRHIRQKHRNIHSNQCLLCTFGHDEEYGILKHLIVKHHEWHPQMWCSGCDHLFCQKNKKHEHKQLCGNKLKPYEGTVPNCGQKYRFKWWLSNHMATKHHQGNKDVVHNVCYCHDLKGILWVPNFYYICQICYLQLGLRSSGFAHD